MAVHIMPRQPSWLDYLAPAAQQLLGGVIGGMFDRDKQARDLKFQGRQAEAEQARKQQELAQAQQYFTNTGLDMRGNPNDAMNKIAFMSLIAPNAPWGDMLKSFNANMQRNVTDLRDRSRIETFDPSNGNVAGQEYAYGIDPTNKYAQDAATTRERISQANQNARHNSTGAGQGLTAVETVKILQEQRKQYFNPNTGRVIPGHENDIRAIDARVNAIMGYAGGGAGATSGGAPGEAPGPANPAAAAQQPLPIGSYAAEFGIPQTTLPTEDKREAAIARMMRDTGKSREEILAFLQAQGVR